MVTRILYALLVFVIAYVLLNLVIASGTAAIIALVLAILTFLGFGNRTAL